MNDDRVKNIDSLVNIVNNAQQQKQDIIKRAQQQKQEIIDRTIAKENSPIQADIPVQTKKKKGKNIIQINKRLFIAGGIVVSLAAVSLGIDIGSRIQKAATIRDKYDAELLAAQEKLIDSGLAHLNEDGELIINKSTSVRDYANIATSNFTFVDASCYYDLIKYKEMDKLVRNLEIPNDKGHYYTDFNQYCRINGLIDSNGYPDYSMLYSLARKEIKQTLNESTFIIEQEPYYDTNIGGRSQ